MRSIPILGLVACLAAAPAMAEPADDLDKAIKQAKKDKKFVLAVFTLSA